MEEKLCFLYFCDFSRTYGLRENLQDLTDSWKNKTKNIKSKLLLRQKKYGAVEVFLLKRL